jgi:hypothetical protein
MDFPFNRSGKFVRILLTVSTVIGLFEHVLYGSGRLIITAAVTINGRPITIAVTKLRALRPRKDVTERLQSQQ